jgi:hypothetical protein
MSDFLIIMCGVVFLAFLCRKEIRRAFRGQ